MTLDVYKTTRAEVLDGLPLELCAGQDYYAGADRLTLCRLHTLYEMASIHETAGDDEPMQFFEHWWELPVDERLKRAVLSNVKAV